MDVVNQILEAGSIANLLTLAATFLALLAMISFGLLLPSRRLAIRVMFLLSLALFVNYLRVTLSYVFKVSDLSYGSPVMLLTTTIIVLALIAVNRLFWSSKIVHKINNQTAITNNNSNQTII